MLRKSCAAIAMVMALVSAAVSSCRKTHEGNQTVKIIGNDTERLSDGPGGSGSEDDDGEIPMKHKSVNAMFQPIQGAEVILITGTDTLHAFSDSQGFSDFNVPSYGQYHVKVNHMNYQQADSLFVVADSISVKTSVLEEQ